MDTFEAIKTRRSVRAYKSKPVPREILEEVLNISLCAPSFGNIQPWELAIVGGETLSRLKQAILDKVNSGTEHYPDLGWPDLSEPYRSRYRDGMIKIYQALGIAREDRQRRIEWDLLTSRFFDAPIGIVIYTDKKLGNWATLDIGIVLQTILLAAHSRGLGCCPEAAVVRYPDVVRQVLNIPESKQIIVGIAIGYPDWEQPINKVVTERELPENVIHWF